MVERARRAVEAAGAWPWPSWSRGVPPLDVGAVGLDAAASAPWPAPQARHEWSSHIATGGRGQRARYHASVTRGQADADRKKRADRHPTP